MYGTASFPFMHETARKLQMAMPHAELRALQGQEHNVSPAALAPGTEPSSVTVFYAAC